MLIRTGFITGWAELITKTKIGDATPAIFIVIALFMLPANWNWLRFCGGSKPDELPKATTPSLITWKYINANIPWSLIFLLGGGFALARGGKESGMSAMLGTYLSSLRDLPFLALLFLVCLFAQVFTEFASNVAVANGNFSNEKNGFFFCLIFPSVCNFYFNKLSF